MTDKTQKKKIEKKKKTKKEKRKQKHKYENVIHFNHLILYWSYFI